MIFNVEMQVIHLLADWGLIEVKVPDSVTDITPLNQIKVISFKDKSDWTLEAKYNIGKKKNTPDE